MLSFVNRFKKIIVPFLDYCNFIIEFSLRCTSFQFQYVGIVYSMLLHFQVDDMNVKIVGG